MKSRTSNTRGFQSSNQRTEPAEFSIDAYFSRYKDHAFVERIIPSLEAFRALAVQVRTAGNKLMLAGNGASASISAHGAVDFTKQAGVRAVSFASDNLITCFANDYGYEHWIEKAIEHYYDPGDVVVLISASGRSLNIVEAAARAKLLGLPIVAFSGFEPDNPLRKRADIDFWVPQRAYNVIECIHMIWLTTVIDMVIGRAEYSTQATIPSTTA